MKKFSLLFLVLFSVTARAELPSVDSLLAESQTIEWKEAVSESITVNAPVSELWKYASDSTKAVDWSIYFDHISPLAGPAPDGQVGSLRRCFRNKNEQGEFWDEVITQIAPEKLRQITTYNFGNYPLRFVHKDEYVFVRQIYRAIDDKTSELKFETMYRPESNFIFKLIFKMSRKETTEIFKLNLENIKAAIEGKPRPHAWRE